MSKNNRRPHSLIGMGALVALGSHPALAAEGVSAVATASTTVASSMTRSSAAATSGPGGATTRSGPTVTPLSSMSATVMRARPATRPMLRASAEAIADRVGLGPWATWSIGWQSAGRTPEPWRGPDILEVIRDLAATGRARAILVCPQGFVADHLEVAYDLDIEAARVAAEVGLTFARTRTLNDDPTVMAALARRVLAAADQPR